jgi:hypothetical protein
VASGHDPPDVAWPEPLPLRTDPLLVEPLVVPLLVVPLLVVPLFVVLALLVGVLVAVSLSLVDRVAVVASVCSDA